MHIRPTPGRTRGTRPRPTARLTVALLGAAALLVSACSPGSPTASAGDTTQAALAALPRATPSALSSYYT
ncbi:alpha/beta hydrolase, partial [Streptomyces broussonetiae]